VTCRSSFVVVANRLPVDEEVTPDGPAWRVSPGGLVTALRPVVAGHKAAWVGWGGNVGPAAL
jgi:trehalose 6-phosphate synthase